jgi:hypothetical protein
MKRLGGSEIWEKGRAENCLHIHKKINSKLNRMMEGEEKLSSIHQQNIPQSLIVINE